MSKLELISVRATSRDNDVMAITIAENGKNVVFECDCNNKPVSKWVEEITSPDKIDLINYNTSDDDGAYSINAKLTGLEKLQDKQPLRDYIKTLALSGFKPNKFTPLTDRIFMVM